MVTVEQLKIFISDIESDSVERTTSTKDTDKFGEAICAFANDFPNNRSPGYLLLGVANDGTLSGLKVTDQLLQNLGAIRSDGNIQPLPALTIQRFTSEEGEVAVVKVLASDLPPVRYKGRVWIRVGPRRALATEHEERVLSEKRLSFAKSFDVSPCLGSSRDDLALSQFEAYRVEAIASDVIDSNNRSIDEQLASLRLFDLRSGIPTNAGVLLIGKNPRFYLSGAYIQYLRLPGSELAEIPVDQAEISGDLLSVLRELDTRIRSGVRRSIESRSSLREKMTSDYPEGAVREILMNAVVHRDYQSNTPVRFYWFSDRIEISSPGGLYGEVTPENFLRQSSYRNPILAEAMKTLGYVNRYGYGIQRAQKLLVENGSPVAEFHFERQAVWVVLRRRTGEDTSVL